MKKRRKFCVVEVKSVNPELDLQDANEVAVLNPVRTWRKNNFDLANTTLELLKIGF